MREAAENAIIISDYTGSQHKQTYLLQDGHPVQRLPKGAFIFLSMSLQRLLRRWEKKARMTSLPAEADLSTYQIVYWYICWPKPCAAAIT